MGSSRRAAVAVAVLLTAPLTVAQVRATCSGIVRDTTGAPIAGARVVASWQPDVLTLGARDRREVTASADGAFAFDLFVGYPYCIWAIAPADADGARAVAFPTYEATGGRTLDVVCATRSAPVRLMVRGTTAWINEGPLALRVLIARDCPVGPDIPVPGDGPIPLPPLPNDVISVCLVDGNQQVLDSASVDLTANAAWTLAEPHAFDLVVEDDAGRPVAGARILRAHPCAPQAVNEPVGATLTVHPWRVVATTDANGRAHGLVVRGGQACVLCAVTDTATSGVSGWFADTVIEDGKTADHADDEPLRFVLRWPTRRQVRVSGRRADETIAVGMRGYLTFHSDNGTGQVSIHAATVTDADQFVASVLGNTDTLARILCRDPRPLPSRTVARCFGRGERLPDIDLTGLRTIDLEIVDANGEPVPFAHVGVTEQLRGLPLQWSATLVTDANGRAELRLLDTEFAVYATTTTAHGMAKVPPHGTDPVRLQLVEFMTARVRVVNAAGRPVAGARCELVDRPRGGDAGALLASIWGGTDPFATLRTDHSGETTVRFPVELDGHGSIRAVHADLRSDPETLLAGPSPIVLQLRE